MFTEAIIVRKYMHVQMTNGVFRENMKSEKEIVFTPQPQEFRLQAFKIGEDGVAHRHCVFGRPLPSSVARWRIQEGVVAVFERFLGAGEDGEFAGFGGPEAEEVRAEFLKDSAGVVRRNGVNHVEDAGLGDDEGVTVALAFRALLSGGERVLAAVVGSHVANYVGGFGLAEDEAVRVMEGVFL